LAGCPCRYHITFPHQYLGLCGMRQGESVVGYDSAVKSLDCARIKGQRQIAALYVGVARRGGGSAHGEVVSVCEHIEYSKALLKI
jgi:hypothetical protein